MPPLLDDIVDPLDDNLPPPLRERRLLRIVDALEHAGEHGVRDAEVEEQPGGPDVVGADGGVLRVGDGVLAERAEERLDWEDEAVEGGAVRDVLDLGDDLLVGLGRLVALACLEEFLAPLDVLVGALYEAAPRLGDGAGVVVVGCMKDEETQIVVISLIGVVVEELTAVSELLDLLF